MNTQHTLKLEYRNPSLATIAKEYTFEYPEIVEEYILDNLNEEMGDTYKRLKKPGVKIDFIIMILIQMMTESELINLGKYLLSNYLIERHKDHYYFEKTEEIPSEWKPIFDGTSLIVD